MASLVRKREKGKTEDMAGQINALTLPPSLPEELDDEVEYLVGIFGKFSYGKKWKSDIEKAKNKNYETCARTLPEFIDGTTGEIEDVRADVGVASTVGYRQGGLLAQKHIGG